MFASYLLVKIDLRSGDYLECLSFGSTRFSASALRPEIGNCFRIVKSPGTMPDPLGQFILIIHAASTVREAAYLHSYSDWFRFHVTKWHGFRQVGNSVPPLLARAVACELAKTLEFNPSHLPDFREFLSNREGCCYRSICPKPPLFSPYRET